MVISNTGKRSVVVTGGDKFKDTYLYDLEVMLSWVCHIKSRETILCSRLSFGVLDLP